MPEHEPPPTDDPPGMARYVVGFLVKGPHWGEGSDEEQERIQAAHVASNQRLLTIGAAAALGPFLDGGSVRGLLVFRETSHERIRSLVAEDPALLTGRLVLELRPWLGPAGLSTTYAP
jgi:hypothetical protein